MNFGDLRAILQYVPQFRGATFVIALDGAVIESPDFSNLLLDLAVLRSLNIDVVLVHGAAAQIEALGKKRSLTLSDTEGVGETDEVTLEVAIDAISRLTNSIMHSLSTVQIRAASANAIRANRAGIINGIDLGSTGLIEKVDSEMLQSFLEQGILPVISPLGFDGEGKTLRINSDSLAREVAVALGAEKIVFLSIDDPLEQGGFKQRHWSIDKSKRYLEGQTDKWSTGFVSKVKEAITATRDRVPRVHLIGAEKNDALLAELFSNEGIGLMIYADCYHQVRPATVADTDEICSLIRRAVENDQLIERPRSEIVEKIADYLVLSIDENIVGCVAVHHYPENKLAELACLFVKNGHGGLGYGTILVDVARQKAQELEVDYLFALSTQAADYLEKVGFQRELDLSKLPLERYEQWKVNGRNAVLLVDQSN